MAWLRLYDDLLDSPKVQKLDPELFKAYINILCVARKEDAGGVLPCDEDLAFYLREDVSRVTSRVTALIEAKCIDEKDGLREIHDWKTLQFESDKDPTAKERKRRQRDKENGDNGVESESPPPDDGEDVTGDVTRDGTDVSRPPEQSRTDTESEQKRDASPAAPEPPVEKKPFSPPKGVAPASKLPTKSEWAGTELRKLVEDSFGIKNLGDDGQPRYGNWKKEQKVINGICTMIRNLTGGKREIEAAQLILAEFWKLTQGKEKYWREQPFTPGGLSPVFDRVVGIIRKRGGVGPPRSKLADKYEQRKADQQAGKEAAQV